MKSTYREVIDRIRQRGRFGDLGLDRIGRLLDRLGHPERDLRIVHIAGTNGKGSTAAFLESVLRTAGERVGLFTSPHVFDWRERIQVNRRWISEQDLMGHVEEINRAAADDGDPLTEFEVWTAAALLHFRQEGVTDAILEVGLGGRLDATNVVERPRATAVVSIGLDHLERLGPDIPTIAGEKAGILKPGVPVVVGRMDEAALEVIARRARALAAPLYRWGRELGVHADRDGRNRFWGFGREVLLRPRLLGRHQVENAALAVALALLVRPEVATAVVEEGVRLAAWPGRAEEIRSDPPIIVDAAKNPMGMRALRETLDACHPDMPIHLVFGCLGERDPVALLEPLADRVARGAVHALDDPRALPEAVLLEAAAQVGIPATPVRTMDGVKAFLEGVPRGGLGVVTGSFYLVGPVLQAFGRAEGREGG